MMDHESPTDISNPQRGPRPQTDIPERDCPGHWTVPVLCQHDIEREAATYGRNPHKDGEISGDQPYTFALPPAPDREEPAETIQLVAPAEIPEVVWAFLEEQRRIAEALTGCCPILKLG